jgi:formylglycine-generating enzyme required for sulfatase activity
MFPADLVRFNAGSYTVGSERTEKGRWEDELLHNETLNSFYVCDHEVTVAEYKEVVGSISSRFLNEGNSDQIPISGISFFDAVIYCNKLSAKKGLNAAYVINGTKVERIPGADGYRLPTEWEWEVAARGGSTTPFNTGTFIATDKANFDQRDDSDPYHTNGTFYGKPAVVKSFEPNSAGLFDTHGNLREWTESTYPSETQADAFRVVRGGCWSDNPSDLRSAWRGEDSPDTRSDFIGFRVARSIIE